MVSLLALVQLTHGSHSSYGLLEILYQGEWYTICGSYYYSNSAKVVCKELGFDRGFVGMHRVYISSSESRDKLWIRYSYNCKATEGSIYDCVISHVYDRIVRRYCYGLANYSCQGMYNIAIYLYKRMLMQKYIASRKVWHGESSVNSVNRP